MAEVSNAELRLLEYATKHGGTVRRKSTRPHAFDSLVRRHLLEKDGKITESGKAVYSATLQRREEEPDEDDEPVQAPAFAGTREQFEQTITREQDDLEKEVSRRLEVCRMAPVTTQRTPCDRPNHANHSHCPNTPDCVPPRRMTEPGDLPAYLRDIQPAQAPRPAFRDHRRVDEPPSLTCNQLCLLFDAYRHIPRREDHPATFQDDQKILARLGYMERNNTNLTHRGIRFVEWVRRQAMRFE